MMDLGSAIQHCKEQVQEQAKKGCYRCAEEHQQLAEWLKELKEYKEQRGERMNESEKERLIKKDIVSIENRVRHAFNQGYEMGLKAYREKLNCTDCIIDSTDACSRGAGRAVDDERCGDFIPSRSEIPNTCGDAISRHAVMDCLKKWQPYMATRLFDFEKELSALPSITPQPCDDAISRQAVLEIQAEYAEHMKSTKFWKMRDDIKALPSVTPQQKMGHWFAWKPEDDAWRTTCSECGEETRTLWNYCPHCGAKMEVEE